MKGMIGKILCAAGFHKLRELKNGKASERVCMRPDCEFKIKLYRLKGGVFEIWTQKSIPVGRHTFIKTERSREK